MTETEWIIDCFINFLNSERWSQNIDTFINQHQHKFIAKDADMEEHLALHEIYHDLAEPLLNDFLSEIEITYPEFKKGIDDMENQNKLQNYRGLLNRIISIYEFPIFRQVMHDANNQVDLRPFISTNYQNSSFPIITIDDQEQYMEQILKLSKDAYDMQEYQLNKRLEHDIYESIELSKDEYNLYRQNLIEEQKMLEQAIELSIKEIEIREAEEMALLKPFLKSAVTLTEIPDKLGVIVEPNSPEEIPAEVSKLEKVLSQDKNDQPRNKLDAKRPDVRPTLDELKLRKEYLLGKYGKIKDKLQKHTVEEVINGASPAQAGPEVKPSTLEECNEKLREHLLLIDKG